MHVEQKHLEWVYLFLLVLVIVALPLGLRAYDQYLWQGKVASGDKLFTLTGHTRLGWVHGEIRAHDILSAGLSGRKREAPTLVVAQGDRVTLKLKSSDVVHGFSLKDFGLFITDGIQPGRPVLISFTADKEGIFTFSCNAICGDNHKNMQGTLVVTA